MIKTIGTSTTYPVKPSTESQERDPGERARSLRQVRAQRPRRKTVRAPATTAVHQLPVNSSQLVDSQTAVKLLSHSSAQEPRGAGFPTEKKVLMTSIKKDPDTF
jgi:hypothetical protein